MNKEKISVETFINSFKELKTEEEKRNFVASAITRQYVPVLEKQLALQTMLNTSIITDENHMKYIDMFLSKISLNLAIISLYTNIKCSKPQEDNRSPIDDYDDFRENNLFNMVCSFIPEAELTELSSIQNSLIETFYNKYSSTEAVLNRLMKNLDIVLKTFGESGEKFLQMLPKE